MESRCSVVAVAIAVAVVVASCGSSAPSSVVEVQPAVAVGDAGQAAEPAAAVTVTDTADVTASPTTVERLASPSTVEPLASPSSVEPLAPQWTTAELGEPDVDTRVAVAAVGESVVVMLATGERLAAWVDAGDGWTPADVGREAVGARVQVQALGAVSGGVLAVVNYREAPAPELWFSADGSSWEQLSAEGLDGPAWVGTLAATGAGVLIVGALSSEEGPFEPVLWRSEDLTTWTTTEIHARGDVVAAGSSLLVAGPGLGGALMWRSGDDGRTWEPVPAQEVDGGEGLLLNDMAAGNGAVVAVGSSEEDMQGFAVLSSSDDGRSWVRTELDPGTAAGLRGSGAGVQRAGGAFWIIASRYFDAWDHYDRCYVDVASCQAYAEPVVLRSTDGIHWAEVDIDAVDPPEYYWAHDVVDAGDGVVLVRSAPSVLVSRWPSSAAPPLRAPPETLEAPAFELAWNTVELAVGTTYRLPLYIHCGMDYLADLNGRHWYLAEAPKGTVETGAGHKPPSNWPVAQQTIFGYVTLIDDNTIEYTITDGDVIATYEPSDKQPPGCG